MSQKDYEKISNLLCHLHVGSLANTSCGDFTQSLYTNGYHCETLIDSLCDLFVQDNPNFKRKKFIEACGFDAWKELVMGVPRY